jgi:2-polyprenyl-3-methyl-5-hydroxy-6-metoxy-1,4-benzoquinol methylase
MVQGKGQSHRVLDGPTLHASAMRRLRRRQSGSGILVVPALPSLCDYYLKKTLDLFELLGRPFNADEVTAFREIMERMMTKAWRRSPYAALVLHYETQPEADGGINYNFKTVTTTVGAEYDRWVGTRPQPFFGARPNPKVLHLARSLGTPAEVAVLDVGAAEGRNTLPLAREGFAVDANELSPKFAELLRSALTAEKLGARVFEGDFLEPSVEIPRGHYRLVVLAGVLVAHVRDLEHFRAILARACESLTAGGLLLFNLFVTQDGYTPDALTRELGELFWTVMFTPAELAEVTKALPLELIDDVPFVEYERTHDPEGWPPTDFFAAYCEAQDLFDLQPGEAPLSLRWLTYRKG